jgi:hypothetical protein
LEENHMTDPSDTLVANVISKLDEGLREEWEERAAIIEYDAGLPRGTAEVMALADLAKRHPEAISDKCIVQHLCDIYETTLSINQEK